MRADVSRRVDAVFGRGLEIHRRLQLGEELDLSFEQGTLVRLLGGRDVASSPPELTPNEPDIRYALTCWVDELFIVYSPWTRMWNERKLEVLLYNSNDRAWRFWEGARRAMDRTADLDTLEVYYLAVMLGFQGNLLDHPKRRIEWTSAARSHLGQGQQHSWASPPEIVPPTRVPPLHQRKRLRTMIVRAGFALLFTIPIIVYSLLAHFG